MNAEAQLKQFIAKFEPRHQKMIRAARKVLRAEFPGAFELVYDNYNFFVIGYSPTERPSDSVLSLTANAHGLGICFIYGKSLPDPHKVLKGSGNQVRSMHLESVDQLDHPHVKALIAAAKAKAEEFQAGRGTLVIRSVSAKQRPRRKS